MKTSDQVAAVAAELLQKAKLPATEVEYRLASALEYDYWSSLAPFVSIGSKEIPPVAKAIAEPVVTRELRRLESHGYFAFGPLLSSETITRMRRIIETVRHAGWPPAFAFVFDDFWNVARGEQVSTFLERALGPSYQQNSNLWAHWIESIAGAHGWAPHVDRCEREGDKMLSLWIPLSDATLSNGCMFLVPHEGAGEAVVGQFCRKERLELAACQSLLRHVTPLPAIAGSLMGWHGNVIHWGGMNRGDSNPRISLAIEFVRRDADASEDELPLIDPRAPLPTLRERLFAIAKGLMVYGKFELQVSKFSEFAKRLHEATRAR